MTAVSFDDFGALVAKWLQKLLDCGHGDDRIPLMGQFPEEIRRDFAFGQVAPKILEYYEESGSKIFYEESRRSFTEWVREYYGLTPDELVTYINLFNLAYGLMMDGPGFDHWFKNSVKVA